MNTTEVIKFHLKEAKKLRQSASNHEEVVSSLRKVCDHDWVGTGEYGHNGEWQECTKCLLERD